MLDTNTTTQVVNGVNQLADKIGKGIEVIGQKLGVAAAAVWGILVKQALVQGLTDSIIALLGISLIVTLVKFIFSFVKKGKEWTPGRNQGYSDNPYPWYVGFAVAGLLFVTPITLNFLIDSIQELLNPQYFALQKIMDMVK